MNDEQVYLVTVTDPDEHWVTAEFFDGHNTVIDTGFDKPTKVRLHSSWEDRFLDVLHDGPPTPSELWEPLTIPGVVKHPDDLEETP